MDIPTLIDAVDSILQNYYSGSDTTSSALVVGTNTISINVANNEKSKITATQYNKIVAAVTLVGKFCLVMNYRVALRMYLAVLLGLHTKSGTTPNHFSATYACNLLDNIVVGKVTTDEENKRIHIRSTDFGSMGNLNTIKSYIKDLLEDYCTDPSEFEYDKITYVNDITNTSSTTSATNTNTDAKDESTTKVDDETEETNIESEGVNDKVKTTVTTSSDSTSILDVNVDTTHSSTSSSTTSTTESYSGNEISMPIRLYYALICRYLIKYIDEYTSEKVVYVTIYSIESSVNLISTESMVDVTITDNSGSEIAFSQYADIDSYQTFGVPEMDVELTIDTKLVTIISIIVVVFIFALFASLSVYLGIRTFKRIKEINFKNE